MLIFAFNFLFGIMVFSLKSTLIFSNLELSLFFALLVAVLLTFKRYNLISMSLIFFAAGFAWMGTFSTTTLQTNIAEKNFNTPISVVGKIQDLPKQSAKKTQFSFQVSEPFQGKIKLSWYGKPPHTLQSNDTWRILIKIKHNNSYQNIGGFDYEQWLFYQQFDATGYVKKSNNNQLLTASNTLTINSIRQNIRLTLSSHLTDFSFLGVINALIIGDRSLISQSHWDLFKATNTTHLSVISGLHIGLISGFIFLLFSFLWRLCAHCSTKIPARVVGAYFGLLSAFIYALIAGFSIPTQRAFVMASVIFITLILRRHHNVWQLYGIALLLVLASNPLSVFSVGFWLSFYVVAIIIYAAMQHKKSHWFVRLLYIQLIISLATLPLIAWFFDSGSILSPIANLVAIPVFSFVTTPLSLLGAVLLYLQLPYLSNISFSIANESLEYLSILLRFLQDFNFNQWHYTPRSSTNLIILIVAALIAILPGALKLRKISLMLLLIVWIQPNTKIKQAEVLITTLDVGQGLAQVVRTKNHTLLFDTGAKYPSGFNMGDAVINPYLRTQQIKSLDLIIISHGDNDHIGGLSSVLKKFKSQKILSSIPEKISAKSNLCRSLASWQWDGVKFQMLNVSHSFIGNNASCVLKISTQQYSILLTGDIEKEAEAHLIKIWPDALKSDILISPHHGSKTSSSDAFLAAVNPQWVIISSGYKNRFNHPAKPVTDRYKKHNIKILNTNCSGQINIKLADQIEINQYRQSQKRYFWRTCPPNDRTQ